MCKLTHLAIAAALFPLSCHAGAFEPRTYPYLPVLTLDSDLPLCGAFLGAVRQSYLGRDYEVAVDGRDWPGLPVRWVFDGTKLTGDQSHYNETLQRNIISVPAELDRDGKKSILVLTNEMHSWQGYWNSLLVFPSQESAKAWMTRDDSSPLKDRNGWGEGRIVVENAWLAPSVVAVAGRHFVLSRPFSVYFDQSMYDLAQIRADGSTLPTCRVALEPIDPQASDHLSATLPAGRIQDFVHLLQRIAGKEGSCGTLHANTTAALRAIRVTRRAILRPWTLPGDDMAPYNSRAEVERALAEWGGQSLWNYRQYKQLDRLEAAAREALGQYYVQNFGVGQNDAELEAIRVVDMVFRSHFKFAKAETEPDQRRDVLTPNDRRHIFDLAMGRPEKPETRLLKRALLVGMNAGDINALLDAGAELAPAAPEYWDGELHQTEQPLVYALEHPELVRLLLDRGANPNAVNPFGKTALMYAAQFGLIDSLRILLDRGADVNARTNTVFGCSLNVQTPGRTAVTYATDNGHPEIIQHLVEHGAAPPATRFPEPRAR